MTTFSCIPHSPATALSYSLPAAPLSTHNFLWCPRKERDLLVVEKLKYVPAFIYLQTHLITYLPMWNYLSWLGWKCQFWFRLAKTKRDPDLIFGTNSRMRIQSFFFRHRGFTLPFVQRTGTRTVISKKKRLESSPTWRLTTHSNETWSDFQKQNQNQGFFVLGRSRLETKFLDPFICGNRIETSIILICFFQNS
jgi:hypothetical protein